MNIAVIFGILIIITGDASVIEKSSNKAEIGQRILLRKLQNFQNTPRDNVKSVTWNEVLADVLVKKIKIFSFISSDDSLAAEKRKNNIMTDSVSQMLAIYKTFYDKFNTKHEVSDLKTIDDKETIEDTETIDDTKAIDDSKATGDPKEEVEIVESKKHGKTSCDDCEDEASRVTSGCPEGQEKNQDGNCEDKKPEKIIISVPNQCPIGYRADRHGYCRMRF